jgi:hypothetical protein
MSSSPSLTGFLSMPCIGRGPSSCLRRGHPVSIIRPTLCDGTCECSATCYVLGLLRARCDLYGGTRERCVDFVFVVVPCLDLANHSRGAVAYFEETKADEIALLLRKGCVVPAKGEITINYGGSKSAAEMLFSYGFIEPDTPARSLVIPLETMDDDPLTKAKLHVFGAAPTLRIEDRDDGVPRWTAPFAYLMCLNEEDGIQFGLLQQTDGTRQLKLYWQGEDVTDKAGDFESLINGNDLEPLFQLRVVTVILELLQQQVETLEKPFPSLAEQGIVRAELLESILRLRNVELSLMQRALQGLEDQVRVPSPTPVTEVVSMTRIGFK